MLSTSTSTFVLTRLFFCELLSEIPVAVAKAVTAKDLGAVLRDVIKSDPKADTVGQAKNTRKETSMIKYAVIL
jgi:hypothetical protein